MQKVPYHKHYGAHNFFRLYVYLHKPYIENHLIFYTAIQNFITWMSYSLFNQYSDTFIIPVSCYSKKML